MQTLHGVSGTGAEPRLAQVFTETSGVVPSGQEKDDRNGEPGVSEVSTEPPSPDRGPTSPRLSSALRHLVQVAGVGQERDLIDVVLQAAAIWYDLDVRGYRRHLHGRFVLEAWLPGADLSSAPRDFSGFATVSGCDIVRISSFAEQEQLGWHGLPGDLLMLPIPFDTQAQPRWVLVTSDNFNSPVDPCLLMLCQILGVLLQQSAAKKVEEVQQRLLHRLVQSDEPLEQVTEAAIKDLVNVVDGAQARLVVQTAGDAHPRIIASVGGDWTATPPTLETGQSVVSAKRITVWLALGPGVVAVFDMCPDTDTEFTDTQGTLVEAGLMVLGVWLSGRLNGATSEHRPSVPRSTADFESRIADEVRLAARLTVPAGLLVMDVPPSSASVVPRSIPSPVLQDVSRQIRSWDLAGRLDGGHLAVLFLQVDAEGVKAAGNRIRRRLDAVARGAGLPPVRLGLAAFAPGDESVASVVARARANAVRSEPGT